ncbi:MAG: PD40 domain-containing protein [Anaerolineales bacterium]|nr:PD40 domain-containing protein [Anaerolineales bacterium]
MAAVWSTSQSSAEDEYEQIWSPDGTKIAFISSRDKAREFCDG